jgi:DNA polymerase elongation subunit (family B)
LGCFLFFNHGFYTSEHDIPYHQRSLIDLASEDKIWLFDSDGKKVKLKCLIYDIETTEFDLSSSNIPIDIIGYNDFDISFESSKNLGDEEFSFDIIDCPKHSEDIDVPQLISRNVDEEIENLFNFCKILKKYHVISGHNIAGFDNIEIHKRLKWFLSNHISKLSKDEEKLFNNFIDRFSRVDKSFHFGIGSEVVNFYPCCFDTYQASRKFYPFLDSFSLKNVAPFIGVGIKDRLILSPSQIKIDNQTLKYNRQDIIEQRGVTLNLIQQALPLSFTTCMTFDNLLSSGAVNMWDHMAMIRGALQKKIMPPICRPFSISRFLLQNFKDLENKVDIVKKGKSIRDQLSKEFVRVLKYGEEMPDWVRYPYVIYNPNSKDSDDRLNYHIPGGMTIKPDKDAKSHFIPWYYVIVADVGAMYPTILKAMNVGADTVRICSKSKKGNELIWMKRLPRKFLDSNNCNYAEIDENDSYADKGYKLDIEIDDKPGVINCAMTGILSVISKVKKELKDAKKSGDKSELDRLKMMYQSVKGARNAGTHGILSAPNVSGRQFNPWGAAAITTKGQMILADTLDYLKKKNIRVVYGDTDGIYLGCSRSIGNLPDFSKSLNLQIEESKNDWLSNPEFVLKSIEDCNILRIVISNGRKC